MMSAMPCEHCKHAAQPSTPFLLMFNTVIVITTDLEGDIPMNAAGETEIKHLNNEQATDDSHFKDKDGNILEVQEKLSMLEWLANNYKKFGCALEFVSNKSQEGSQFCRGFGGIGGLLRYAVDLTEFEAPEDHGEEFWNSDEDI